MAQFLDLPPELRLRIWYFLTCPRIVSVLAVREFPGYIYSKHPAPLLLSICSESRSYGLEIYEYAFGLDPDGWKNTRFVTPSNIGVTRALNLTRPRRTTLPTRLKRRELLLKIGTGAYVSLDDIIYLRYVPAILPREFDAIKVLPARTPRLGLCRLLMEETAVNSGYGRDIRGLLEEKFDLRGFKELSILAKGREGWKEREMQCQSQTQRRRNSLSAEQLSRSSSTALEKENPAEKTLDAIWKLKSSFNSAQWLFDELFQILRTEPRNSAPSEFSFQLVRWKDASGKGEFPAQFRGYEHWGDWAVWNEEADLEVEFQQMGVARPDTLLPDTPLPYEHYI
jgi:hypothetical protein